jgi:2,3-dihydroxy-p-cumate/2,3-dihydroxybenzoate 3,4-dioxygenase
MPTQLEQLRYVRLSTRDLPGASQFATQILGLQQVGAGRDHAYFRSDSRDFTLCYFKGEVADQAFSIDVRTSEELGVLADTLLEAGYTPRRGSEDEAALRKVKTFIAFQDNTGNAIEIVWRPLMTGWRYFPSRDAGVCALQSLMLRTTNPEKDEALWTRFLGARVTDRIGDGVYLTWDDTHHRIALLPSDKKGVLSIEYEVEGINQIMQANYFLRDAQLRIVHGPGREPASGRLFVTFEGHDGVLFSYVSGTSATAADRHLPRQFPHEPQSFCSWGSVADVVELGGERRI